MLSRSDLHPYQTAMVERLVNEPNLYLAADMGLGKSVTTLTGIVDLLDQFVVSRVLIVAPLRVAREVWAAEAAKWEHTRGLRIATILGPAAERIAAANSDADVYVVNRENLAWLVATVSWRWDMLVVDEASGFKSRSAVRFKALRSIRGKIDRVVLLSGTPAPNTMLDLWPQFWLLDGGQRLGRTLSAYREAFFEPDKRSQTQVFSWRPRRGAEEEIHRRISDIMVSLKAVDYLDMPERVDCVQMVNLGPVAADLYAQLEADMLLPFANGAPITAANAAVLGGKLLQLCNGASYAEDKSVREIHTAKLAALGELLPGPLLCFYSFRHDADRIERVYPQAVRIDAPDAIERWNRGEVDLLLAHPASAGHGLNLQAGGNRVVWFGLPWSLELYLQANARLHRQGQTKPVEVVHLLAEDTIDSTVFAALQDKDAGQSRLLAAVKARIPRKGHRTPSVAFYGSLGTRVASTA